LAGALAEEGWSLVLDARSPADLAQVTDEIGARLVGHAQVRARPGDVTDAGHRRDLIAEARALGGLDLLVNNASTLGQSPLPRLADISAQTFRRVLEVNTVAPMALISEALPLLRLSTNPRVVNLTSDASVEHYESWGGYGSSKAALDHLSVTLAIEEPAVRVWAVDPGDMRTQMHQDAFPGEDISDRPQPDDVVPALLTLIAGDRPSGRIRAAEVTVGAGGVR
jgi:NAD(P)-dependent dehydrogenase (short-subunit alcohol dehydrogenase family)